jgi:gluconokinase
MFGFPGGDTEMMRPIPMKLPPVLAIDLGTSSVRAGLFDVRGKRVPGTIAQRIYTLKTARDGKAELDPFDVLRQTKACIKEATAGWHTISAVGMSCFWHSLLGTDGQGNPLTPIYTWADSRCSEDAARLREELGEREVHAETGCMVRSSFWPAKLRWLQRTDRARFRRVRYWMSPGEWVQWRLAGESRCAFGMATATGLFNPTSLDWSARLLEACNFSADRMLSVGDEPADWRGIPWYPAIGDGAASNLGSGATEGGRGAINVGTSAALRVMREGPVAEAPFGLFAYRVDARRYLVGGAVSNAGNLHAWCLRELRLNDNSAAIEKALSERPSPEHGLTVLPFWSAERAPTWDENAQGAILGLRQSTSALDLLQAITEGFYHRLGMIAEMVAGDEQPKWIVAGGILKSKSALRRLANVMGRSIYANPEPEASLRGAAVFAIEKLGHPIAEMKYGPATMPSPSIHRLYRADRARQARLEAALG